MNIILDLYIMSGKGYQPYICKGKGKGYIRPPISKDARRNCWNAVIPLRKGYPYCPLCKKNKMHTQLLGSWQAGHIEAHSTGGADSSENLIPICPKCNIEQGAENMLTFVEKRYPQNYISFRNLLLLKTVSHAFLFRLMLLYTWDREEYCKKKSCGPAQKCKHFCKCGKMIAHH